MTSPRSPAPTTPGAATSREPSFPRSLSQSLLGSGNPVSYEDIPGFCKAAKLDDIRKHGHVLTPGRYVGAEAAEDDGEPFEEKMKRLAATLREQQTEAAKLDAAIAANLKELGYGGCSGSVSLRRSLCRRSIEWHCRSRALTMALLLRPSSVPYGLYPNASEFHRGRLARIRPEEIRQATCDRYASQGRVTLRLQ